MSAFTVAAIIIVPFLPWLLVTGWRAYQRYTGGGE